MPSGALAWMVERWWYQPTREILVQVPTHALSLYAPKAILLNYLKGLSRIFVSPNQTNQWKVAKTNQTIWVLESSHEIEMMSQAEPNGFYINWPILPTQRQTEN
jgi:hypothetical protein